MADVAMVVCFKSSSCYTRIVQVMAKSNYQKKKVHFCISCIQTLVMHMTVELCSICGTMFSGICIHVLNWAWSSRVCAVADWLPSPMRLRAAIFLDWWSSFSEVNNVTYTLASSVKIENDYLKKKSLVGMIFIFLLYYLMFFFILMHYCSFN